MSIDFQIATRYPVNEDSGEWVLYNFNWMMYVDDFEIKRERKTVPAAEYIKQSFKEIQEALARLPTAYNAAPLPTQGILLKMVSVKLIRILAHLVLHSTPSQNYEEVVKELIYMIDEYQVFNEKEYNASLKMLTDLVR